MSEQGGSRRSGAEPSLWIVPNREGWDMASTEMIHVTCSQDHISKVHAPAARPPGCAAQQSRAARPPGMPAPQASARPHPAGPPWHAPVREHMGFTTAHAVSSWEHTGFTTAHAVSSREHTGLTTEHAESSCVWSAAAAERLRCAVCGWHRGVQLIRKSMKAAEPGRTAHLAVLGCSRGLQPCCRRRPHRLRLGIQHLAGSCIRCFLRAATHAER